MKRKLLIFTTVLIFNFQSFAQSYTIHNNGAHIKSTSGTYWVVDNGNYTLNSASATYLTQWANLSISSDAGITLPAGTCATVTGSLQTASGGWLQMKHGSSLITTGSITNLGNITNELDISDGEYHILASPNNNTLSGMFVGDYLLEWNEPNQEWTYVTSTELPLIPATGYFLWGMAKNTTHTFSGTPNTGNQAVALTASGSGTQQGFNLVGNPYPSSIDWSLLDETYGAIYYWNPTSGTYVSWIAGTGSGSQFAAPMQGFFIYTPSAGTFALGNSVRTHEGANSYYKLPDEKISDDALVLLATRENSADELHLVFDPMAAAGFELQRDAWKLKSTTAGVIQLYSLCPDGNLSIDHRPMQEIIQLGFSLDQESQCSIELKEFIGSETLWLEDTKENTFTELNQTAYSFLWEVNDSEHRFRLHRTLTSLPNAMRPDEVEVYSYGKTLFLRSQSDPKKVWVDVIDMTGKMVSSENLILHGTTAIELVLPPAAYAVRLSTGNQRTVKKIIIP